MELRQLRYFMAVARKVAYSTAAEPSPPSTPNPLLRRQIRDWNLRGRAELLSPQRSWESKPTAAGKSLLDPAPVALITAIAVPKRRAKRQRLQRIRSHRVSKPPGTS